MDEPLKDVAGDDVHGRGSPSQLAADEEIFRLLSEDHSIEHAPRLRDIKSRIRRSLDDPRPSLPLSQVDDLIDALVAKARVIDDLA